MLEKLNRENICDEGINKHQASKQEKKFAMVSNIPVLLANQAFRSFSNQPMEHPQEQDDSQRQKFVDIQSVAKNNTEQKDLEDLLLTFFDQML